MKRFQVVFSLAVFLGIALAFLRERASPPGPAGFGFETTLPLALDPLPSPAATLEPASVLEIVGRVTTASGEPAADVLVALLPAGDDAWAAGAEPLGITYTDERGGFVLRRLVAGEYRVILTHASAPPSVESLTLPHEGALAWTLREPLPPLPALPEIRRGPLEGRLRQPGDPLAGALATGSASLEGFEVVLRPEPGTHPLSGASVRRVVCDAGGRFTLEDLVLARYRAEVLPPWAHGGSWPVLARATLEVASTESNSLVLPIEAGELEGELLEAAGQPLEGALVQVASLDALDAAGTPQSWPPTVTDANGRFAISHLPPGRYRLRLSAGLSSRAVEVQVEAGRRTRVPLERMDPRAAERGSSG